MQFMAQVFSLADKGLTLREFEGFKRALELSRQLELEIITADHFLIRN